jgi:hypothetical protein
MDFVATEKFIPKQTALVDLHYFGALETKASDQALLAERESQFRCDVHIVLFVRLLFRIPGKHCKAKKSPRSFREGERNAATA